MNCNLLQFPKPLQPSPASQIASDTVWWFVKARQRLSAGVELAICQATRLAAAGELTRMPKSETVQKLSDRFGKK